MVRHFRAALIVAAVAAVCFVVVRPAFGQQGVADRTAGAASVEGRYADRVEAGEHLLVVHYHRRDGEYRGWNVWNWRAGEQGSGADFSQRSGFGRYAVIEVEPSAERVGMIVRRGNWEAKDVDKDRWVELEDDGFTEVWLVSGDERVFMAPGEVDTSLRIAGAFLDGGDRVVVTLSGELMTKDMRADRGFEVLLEANEGMGENTPMNAAAYDVRRAALLSDTGAAGAVYELTLSKAVAFDAVSNLWVSAPGVGEPRRVFARDVLNEERFIDLDAELGSRWGEQSTTFRVWSPVSETVELLLYGPAFPNGDGATRDEPVRTIEMTHAGAGVWEAEVAGDLHGVVYQYAYFSYGERRVAADINCFAATLDSDRSVVVDLDRTDPDGWGKTPMPVLAQPTDEVIYEIHVRDYSIANEWISPDVRGTYVGMVTLDERMGEGPGRGISHLQRLGVTAVHLLPIQDFGGSPDEYNWGYWTSLFNVPESNYSTELRDPLRAVEDVKTMVQLLHQNNIRVILDVVYNHTSSSFEWSPFYQSVPYYWFRTTIDGRLRNDAGVGNSVADERAMVRKYIGDSLVYWLEEYRVDGYRFDLLGTHQPESVREWVERMREVRSDVTLYGEPWTGGGPLYFGKGTQRGMGIAVFNDHFRNAIRGDLDGTATGYATGPGGDVEAVKRGVAGAIDDFTDNPTETINYVSAHDNLTFWDKLVLAQPDATDAERRAMHKLAHGIMLTSQGIAFIHGGADFARTKGGNHNSYNAGDEVNKFDWDRAVEYGDVVDYIAGLIELRRSHPAFRMAERSDVRRRLDFLSAEYAVSSPEVVAFQLNGRGVGDEWSRIIVAYNGTAERQVVELPGAGAWTLVVDAERAGVEPLSEHRGEVEVEPFSMVVLHR